MVFPIQIQISYSRKKRESFPSLLNSRQFYVFFIHWFLFVVDVEEEDALFLSTLASNPHFLETSFSAKCRLRKVQLQSPLEPSLFSDLLLFLSEIPSLTELVINGIMSYKSLSLHVLVPSMTTLLVPNNSLNQIHTFTVKSNNHSQCIKPSSPDSYQLDSIQIGRFALTNLCSFELMGIAYIESQTENKE